MTTALSVSESAARSSFIGAMRKVLSLPVAIAGLLVTLGMLTVRSRFDDPDMWWHLKTGQWIWNTGSIPTTDIFSYTTNHHAWVPHEWLSQVLIYFAYRFGGYSGLMLWLCFFTAAILIAGYALCCLYSGNAKVSFVGAMTIWFFATAGLAIRPQMIGYLLLIVELLLIQLGRSHSPRWFFGLPPLFAVWVNCHGSFFLGFLLVCIVLACSFFDFRKGLLMSDGWPTYTRKMLMIALFFSAVALFLNPVGVRQVLYPLNTMFHQSIQLSSVQEWMPLTMNSGRGLGFLVLLGCVFFIVLVQRSELSLNELGMLAVGAWLAIGHRRLLFVFGILAAPVLSRLLAPLWDRYDADHDHPVPNAILIAASLLILALGFPKPQNLASQVEAGSPVKAVDFIERQHLSGPMMNDYVYGGYLIWTASDHPVFVDGRGDVFEWSGVLAEFGRWATLQENPNILLDKYGVRFCVLARTSPMTQVLLLLPNWKSVYSDNMSVILVRTSDGNFSPDRRASLSETNR
ncbi:MAG: hypothetical protein WCE63_01750 [Acidobacteriaceae bacterium]